MRENQDLQKLASELLGEKAIEAFFTKAEARADKMVEKNKKTMSAGEKEEFRHECLRKAVWEQLREFSVDAAQPRLTSKRYWADKVISGAVSGIMIVGGVAALGYVTRVRGSSNEATGETAPGDVTFRAATRPGRRGNVEAVI